MSKSDSQNFLVHIDNAKREIAAAKTVGEALELRNKAEAVRQYAAAAKDTELISVANEFKLRCERRLGEMLKEIELSQGGRPARAEKPVEAPRPVSLRDLNISKDLSSKAQKLAEIPTPKFEQVIAKAKDEKRELTRQTVERLIPREEKPPPDVFQFLFDNQRTVEKLTAYVRELARVKDVLTSKEQKGYNKAAWNSFREALRDLVHEGAALIADTPGEKADDKEIMDFSEMLQGLQSGELKPSRASEILRKESKRTNELIKRLQQRKRGTSVNPTN